MRRTPAGPVYTRSHTRCIISYFILNTIWYMQRGFQVTLPRRLCSPWAPAVGQSLPLATTDHEPQRYRGRTCWKSRFPGGPVEYRRDGNRLARTPFPELVYRIGRHMTTSTGHEASRIILTDDQGNDRDVTKTARRYVAIRQRAVQENLAWLDTGDDAHLRKRDDSIFQSVEIVTTIRDLLGHDASKQFAVEADRVFGPVRFWPD